MQRSITHQNVIGALALYAVFLGYEALASVYLFMPPLLAVLFFYFVKYFDENKRLHLLYIVLLLITFDLEKNIMIFGTLLYFSFVYLVIVPRVYLYLECKSCQKLLFSALAYGGFWLFLYLISRLFLLDEPAFDALLLIYYIIVEFLVLLLL